MLRVRIAYTKFGALRYTSNLDVHRIWERMLRRAGLPLAYSQGFHPQPKINQASPLPLGMISHVEMVEVWFEEDLLLEEIKLKLEQASPPGMLIQDIQPIDLRAPALPTLVISSEYRVTIRENPSQQSLGELIQNLLAAPTWPRERRGKQYDLRPLIEAIDLLPQETVTAGEPRLTMRLSAREGATGRPDEVLLALQLDPNAALIERTRLNIA
jgi:radical SAM-linked protein